MDGRQAARLTIPDGDPATAPPAEWRPLRPRTLVDQVIDALVAGAAEGLILPGDRIVESEIAKKLGVSRVPVREALRILESQGVVISEPYKGIRLTPVTPGRIDQLIEVRVALETSAAVRAVRLGRNDAAAVDRFRAVIMDLKEAEARNDIYRFAAADTEFHRILCGLSGNDVLCALWEMLSRQMTIVFGLASLGSPMSEITEGHASLLEVFRSGDEAAIGQALNEHIAVQTHAVDFQNIIDQRRSQRAPAAPVRIRKGKGDTP